MKRAFWIYSILLVMLFGCKTNTASSKQEEQVDISISEKPNILIIHVDDLGYHDLSVMVQKFTKHQILINSHQSQ